MFYHSKHKTYLLQPPINFFIAYPIAIPIVHGYAGCAYQKIPGVSGESQSPRPHEFPQCYLVPYPRIQMKNLYVSPDSLSRYKLELFFANLGHLRALFAEP